MCSRRAPPTFKNEGASVDIQINCRKGENMFIRSATNKAESGFNLCTLIQKEGAQWAAEFGADLLYTTHQVRVSTARINSLY